MRRALATCIVLLGLVGAVPAEAQQLRPLLSDLAIAAPMDPPVAAVSTEPLLTLPECSRGPATEAVVGAALGALVGATVAFIVGIRNVSSTMGNKRVNPTPYMVGGAAIGLVAGIASWNRRCG